MRYGLNSHANHGLKTRVTIYLLTAMKFPYLMLRDLVETELDADALGDLLTMAGFELEGIEEVEGDKVLDIKVMSNRGDGLSVYGLAREVLAKDPGATPTDLYKRAANRFDESKLPRLAVGPSDGGEKPFQGVAIETDECTRYACLIFNGVENRPSPDWLQLRLRQIGQKPISMLVDLTNYVMLEVGQPLHVFDLDKLAGPKVIVRKARKGEKIIILGGEEFELQTDQMMICDAEKPVAVAGVKGGAACEVDANTRRILLESAHFVSTSVRRTRNQLGLNTDASYRFERSVDPEGVVAALERYAELLAQIVGPQSRVPGVIDNYPNPIKPSPIELDLDRAELLLGMPIPKDQATGYLERLGFQVSGSAVTPPTWRPDVVREEDVIEELGRVHGYEKIPETLPVGTTTRGGLAGFEAWCDRVREMCVRSGFTQTISHSLRDVGPLDEPGVDGVQLRNPNSPEMSWLRTSNLPCLADNARRNRGENIHMFELGRVFSKAADGVSETVRAGFLSLGQLQPADWLNKQTGNANFFSMKGAIETIMEASGVDAEFHPGTDARLHPTKQARIVAGGVPIGVLGQIHPDVAESVGLSSDTVLAELYLEPIYRLHHAAPRLKPISRNPSVRRDISLLIDKSVPYEQIDQALSRSIQDVLERSWLFDVYEGKGIPEGKHSLSIALQLRKQGSNFTDEEANQVREKAVAALVSLGGTPR